MLKHWLGAAGLRHNVYLNIGWKAVTQHNPNKHLFRTI